MRDQQLKYTKKTPLDFELSEECCSAENALTYYINTRINYYIEREQKPNDAKHQLYRELSQFTTKKTTALAVTIVQIHRKIEQYTNENYPISTKNTRKHIHNPEINHEENQQKLETPVQTFKKNVVQSVKKQCLHSPEKRSYYFFPDNKIQLSLGAASLFTSTPQMPRAPNYTKKLKQCNWKDIPITRGYLSLF
ncbi:hypothetical protein G9A89_009067 [Geosiphon pyriformis]|nr:hypothetical protein G9A89_009067 [Geosiphon pyriformis]